ncbi:MAG TPA: heterodisulfide reductase-related iron-sulfur binding cluster [Blastocatellia bacterium]|nr:heterodisulfide reductase-related iron-sulfur binding cluster [Blastocatellia bacterium]
MLETKTTSPHDRLASLLEESHEGLLTCVHCGLCLPACPTYRVVGNENDSPRGRIYLMRALVEGRIEAGEAFTSHIDLCLGCRACETVCPSSVPYGQLLEAARATVAEIESGRGEIGARLTRFALNRLFTRPWLLGLGFRFARWFRDSGIARIAFESDLLRDRVKFALALLISSRSQLKMALAAGNMGPSLAEAASESRSPKASRGLRVAILRGCVMEGLFAATNRATERVLARQGCELVNVPDQLCCGALHAHAGEIETARALARKNIDAFMGGNASRAGANPGPGRIIVNAAGCGAAMKEYGHLLSGDPAYRERARDFSSRVRDVSEFLSEMGLVAPEQTVNLKVTYDAPCHLIHAQRVSQAPIELLKSIPGIEMAPLAGFETCCGGAGIYNLLNPEMSAEILRQKVESIRATGAAAVITGNPGCQMQIGAGLLVNRLPVAVIHPIELLDAAYSGDD